ncbi:hypothetical protein [Aeribacillus pallidus]|uniref:Uncharacterized protein n=1 Tax=Aeribacillus pallidus TaxID=33936 RepID=A0A223E0Z2_9BACI|nr:hypothetical protein [Aeribacillus pallidus]ASS88917.1 hypothetical protein AP3564_00380 [Aeribacillus pallidus]
MAIDNEKIPFPSDKEIQQEIQKIIAKGMNKKPSFWQYMFTMYREVGFRNVFRDLTEIAFTIVLTIAVFAMFVLSTAEYFSWTALDVYTFIFCFSPVVYFVIVFFFFICQKQKPAFEVEMTCKYNVYQLAAFRMFMFSIFAMLANGVIIFWLATEFSIHFPFAFLLSVASLFLFAAAFLYVLLYVPTKSGKIALFISWIAANLFLSYMNSYVYQAFLLNVPYFIYIIIGMAAMYIYVHQLKLFFVKTNIKGVL